ncbi:DUF6452 family protein [Flavobacterium poyangense]|uniref:DUF6452 family protein n=1 Tax=Flavobacterium poyangense TaxID=2204302 RepID=UPI00142406D2|nr:DUF6452 family protein [Flavobacterium sp. JXAS1]
MKKIISFLLLFAFGLSGCEKDDICDADTPTTPRLVITFYDINNATIKKRVTDLRVIGQVDGKDKDAGIIFNKSATGNAMYLTSGDSIAIPLRTDAEVTTYKFILFSGNPNPGFVNEDIVSFSYNRQNQYVSRACGFKTIFNLNTPLAPTVQGTDGLWMREISVQKTNIEFENETHIKVYF